MKKFTNIRWIAFIFCLLLLASCSSEDETVKFTGVVEAPKQTIYSQAEGQIEEIQISENEKVENQDTLGKIDDEFYHYQTQEAKAAMKAIEAEISRLEEDGVDEKNIEVLRFELEQAQLKLDQAEYRQSRTEIVSPNKGIVAEWLVQQGDMVDVGHPLLTLSLDKPMELTIYVPQNKLTEFSVEQTVHISAISLPGETYEGEIVQIGEEAVYSPQSMETTEEKTKKVFPIKIKIEDYGNLKSGMDVIVKQIQESEYEG